MARALGPAAFLVLGGGTDHMLMQPSTEHFPFTQSIRMHAGMSPLHSYTLYGRTLPCLRHFTQLCSIARALAGRTAFRIPGGWNGACANVVLYWFRFTQSIRVHAGLRS